MEKYKYGGGTPHNIGHPEIKRDRLSETRSRLRVFSQNLSNGYHDYYTYCSQPAFCPDAIINYYYDSPGTGTEPRTSDITPNTIYKTLVPVANQCPSTINGHFPTLSYDDMKDKQAALYVSMANVTEMEAPDSVKAEYKRAYQFELDMIANDMMRYKLYDNSYNEKADTLIEIIKDFKQTNEEFKGDKENLLVGLYVEKEDYVKTDSVIYEWQQINEKAQMALLMSVIKELQQNKKSVEYILEDNDLRNKILDILNYSEKEGYSYALEIMKQLYGNTYLEPIYDIETPAERRMIASEDKGLAIKLYPNPSKGIMQLAYQINEGQRGELRIMDVTGRLIANYNLPFNQTNLQISLPNINAGMYIYQVFINGVLSKTDKISVSK
jgi:Secretion system C-terminal sorting domain